MATKSRGDVCQTKIRGTLLPSHFAVRDERAKHMVKALCQFNHSFLSPETQDSNGPEGAPTRPGRAQGWAVPEDSHPMASGSKITLKV